ncbi:MAG TPA: hypothetical protein VL484_20980 [Vicinamibacterales bacterium]|jgi:hypothetical protein|nr:hypothetical protein [Vicinamibacterales bacterium]
MTSRTMLCALLGAVLAIVVVSAQQAEPGRCPGDSKLLNGGPTLVQGDGPGTWWGLVIGGLEAAGFDTDEQKLEYLSQVFGTPFSTLDEAKAYNLDLVESGWDLNQNGYVCAFELRGTRAYSGDPLLNLTTFGISDDKVARKD